MTIDKAKLKALAEVCSEHGKASWLRPGMLQALLKTGAADAEFIAAASPDTILALLAEVERLATSRSKKERELEQELEVWRNGPSCWTCGDTGDVHDITGEWRGECDCLSAQLINSSRERDQLKAEVDSLTREADRQYTTIEAYRKDAERYQWLREADWWRSPVCVIRNPKEQAKLGSDCPSGERLDEAVDAAMGKGEQS